MRSREQQALCGVRLVIWACSGRAGTFYSLKGKYKLICEKFVRTMLRTCSGCMLGNDIEEKGGQASARGVERWSLFGSIQAMLRTQAIKVCGQMKHRNMVRKLVIEGGWLRKRLFDFGQFDEVFFWDVTLWMAW